MDYDYDIYLHNQQRGFDEKSVVDNKYLVDDEDEIEYNYDVVDKDGLKAEGN